MNERKKIEVRVSEVRLKEINGKPYLEYSCYESLNPQSSIKDLIKQLNRYQKEYKNLYSNLRFQEVFNCGCYGYCDCKPSYLLYGTRLENDIEYEFRLKKEKQMNEETEAKDRAEYERLKTRYEIK